MGISNSLDEYIVYLKNLLIHVPDSKTRASDITWARFHSSNKAGPNGPALFNCLIDFDLLRKKENLDLLNAIKTLGGDEFTKTINLLEEMFQLNLLPESWASSATDSSKLRRLVAFPDKEGKQRVIAIMDYFSQTVLKPLHETLFSFLKVMKDNNDFTFDQTSFRKLIFSDSYKNDPHKYHSIDLSSATDRFPIKLIKFFLSGVFPATYVSA